MGGKTSKSTQTVSIPPEVLARYNAVNARAEETAARPFQPYSYNPADFVAQLTPTQLAGIQNVNYAAGQAQPYFEEATNQLMGGQMAAVPYYAQAGQDVGFGQQMGLGFQQQALQDYYYGRQQADPYQQAAGFNIGAAQDIGAQLAQQAYNQQAQAGAAAQPLQGLSLDTLMRAGMTGEGVSQEALANLARAGYSAAPLQQLAQGIYGQAYQAAQPYTQAALQQYYGGLGAAGPLSQAAQQNIAAAQAGVAPYQQFATELGLAAARPVMPEALTGAQVQRYISPYLSNVVAQTQALMNQQAQQAQAEQLGNAIRSGAFGGDRAGIAAANLAQQQQLAQGKVISDLLQSGYGQALATAQQQQQLGLGAEQANRAAQQAAAGQLLGVGQAGFGQGMTAAQQQAALAQQLFGQQAAAGQNIAGLGQQAFTQGMTTGQAQQALAQQLFGQGATTAQQQAAIAQQLFGQGATQAQQQAALAQQVFGQGMSQAQQQAALSQLLFGQGTTAAQQQAALGQQLFGQGLAGSQQMGALGQQGFAQQLAAAQARQGLGQGLYGMGAGTAQQLAALGTGAQGAALQGAQAQLAAGQAQQQTAQAGLQALYNQFLQQQAYPFQTAQFLANIATGTGALSGSTQTAVTPGGLFSDVRMKENIRKVGETFDKQPIYAYNYKGDDKTQMGMLAQEVEKKHPEAVGLAGGMKTVDYDKATRDSVRKPVTLDAEYTSSEGGPVLPHRAGEDFARGGYANGGSPGLASPTDMAALLAAQAQMFGPFSGAGIPTGGMPGMQGYVPAATLPVSELVTPGAMPSQASPIEQMRAIADIGKTGQEIYQKYKQKQTEKSTVSSPAEKADGGSAALPYSGGTQALAIPDEKQEVKKLETPGEMPKGRTVMEDVKDIAQIAATVMAMSDSRMKEDIKHIGNTYDGQKIYSYRFKGEPQTHIGLLAQEVEKKHPDAVGSIKGVKMVDYDAATANAADRAVQLARGKNTGGAAVMPYGMVPTSLGIPSQSLGTGKLSVPDMPEAKSPVDDLKNIVDMAKSVSDINEARKNKYAGGRTGYATNGSVEDPSFAERFIPGIQTQEGVEANRRAMLKPIQERVIDNPLAPWNAIRTALNPPKPAGGLAPASAAVTAPATTAPPATTSAATTPPAARTPTTTAAPQNVPTPPPNVALPSSRFANLPEGPAEGLGATAAPPPASMPSAGLAAPSMPASLTGERDLGMAPMLGGTAATRKTPTDAEVTAKDRSAPVESRMTAFMNWVRQPENFIPLATGVAAATAAPTRNTFVALAQGLGAGAQAYQPVLQKQAELEKTKAETGKIGVEAGVYQANTLRELQQIANVRGLVPKEDPNGIYRVGDKRYSLVPVSEAIAKPSAGGVRPTGAPEAPATGILGPSAVAAAQNAGTRFLIASEPEQAASRVQIDQSLAAGNKARNDLFDINRFAQSAAFPRAPAFEQGALFPIKNQLASFYDSLITTFVQDPEMQARMRIDPAGMTQAQIAEKVAFGTAALREAGAGQRSLGALEAFLAGSPNQTQTRETMVNLIADMIIHNQKLTDEAAAISDFDRLVEANTGLPRSFYYTDAVQAYQKDKPITVYENDRDQLVKIMMGDGYQELVNALKDPKVRPAMISLLDKAYGQGFHRYFTGSVMQ